MPSLPAGPVCCRSASLSRASQHGRICLRLIRRRQDSQGHTSEGSNASAAVLELNFLISSIAPCCQESGPLQSGFPHCTPSFHLIKHPSITELWSSSYHRSSRVYFSFEHLFRCTIAHKNYSHSVRLLERGLLFFSCLSKVLQVNILNSAFPSILLNHYIME